MMKLTIAVSSLATALVLAGTLAGAAPALAAGPSLAIDAGVEGNTATSLGATENCVSVKTGDKFLMDMVVHDVTDLLAWDIPIDYKPEVVRVVDQDVKLFQQANAGSSVLDLSAKLPDDSGFHHFSAVDFADPESPDSGSGVLVRMTFEAVAPGDSPVRFGNRDVDSNGGLDAGSLLRDVNTRFIGDDNNDTFFDGERDDALVVVDGDCPAGSVVAKESLASGSTGSQASNSDGSSFPWLIVGSGGAVVAAVLGAIVVLFLMSRRRGAGSSAIDA
jgi:hypothetical protein